MQRSRRFAPALVEEAASHKPSTNRRRCLKASHIIDEMLGATNASQIPGIAKVNTVIAHVQGRLCDKFMPHYVAADAAMLPVPVEQAAAAAFGAEGAAASTLSVSRGMYVLEVLRSTFSSLQLCKLIAEAFAEFAAMPNTAPAVDAVRKKIPDVIRWVVELKEQGCKVSKGFIMLLWSTVVADALSLVGSAAPSSPPSGSGAAAAAVLAEISAEGCKRWANAFDAETSRRVLPSCLFDSCLVSLFAMAVQFSVPGVLKCKSGNAQKVKGLVTAVGLREFAADAPGQPGSSRIEAGLSLSLERRATSSGRQNTH